MKIKALAILFFFLAVTSTASADTYNRTPSGNVSSESFTISGVFDDIAQTCPAMPWENLDGYTISLLRASDTSVYYTGLESPLFTGNTFNHTFTTTEDRNIIYVSLNCVIDGNTTYAAGVLEGPSNFTILEYVTPPPPPPTGGTFSGMVDKGNTVMASTVGGSVADTVQWTGDSLIKVFIGSGLALLYELRYWIVGLMIISAVVFFAYRAFRFFGPVQGSNHVYVDKRSPKKRARDIKYMNKVINKR